MTDQPLGSSYLLGERLGSGAMGTVYRGRDHDGNAFAFKVLRSELAEEPALVQRFVQERSSLTAVDHPNVVTMHDLVVEGSTLAIVMDLVQGTDLRAVLRERHTLPPGEVARLGAGIAAGLAAVHRAGLVHRDVKPENVLLDSTVSPPTPKVTDFGIARIADASAATRSSMMVGTPNYMAPEVAEGVTPTPAVDVYGLGVILYELCCGVTPFEGGSYLAVIKRHADATAGRPDGIPDDLWAAISDMLAKDPTQRPSAAQVVPFLTVLAEQLSGAPAAAPLPAPPQGGGVPTEQLGRRPEEAPGHRDVALAAPATQTRRRRSKVPVVLGVGLTAAVAAAAIWWTVLREDEEAVADTGEDQVVASAPAAAGTESADATTDAAITDPDETGTAAATTPSVQPTGEEPTEEEPTEEEVSTMPDVVGMTLSAARTELRGTRITVEEDFDDDARDNEVLAQSAAAGQTVPDEVTLTVARQPVTRYLEDLEAVETVRFRTAPAQVDGENYPRSLVSPRHAGDARMSWNLSRGYRELHGTLGRSDEASDTATQVQVEIFLDERKVHTETVAFGEAIELSVDVADALRLKIVANSFDGADMNLVLGDIRLLGLPGEVPELEED